jgi:hypothetical protein
MRTIFPESGSSQYLSNDATLEISAIIQFRCYDDSQGRIWAGGTLSPSPIRARGLKHRRKLQHAGGAGGKEDQKDLQIQ